MDFPITLAAGTFSLAVIQPGLGHGWALELAARLAAAGALRILDGGNCFNVYPVAQALRRQGAEVSAALQRIHVARGFTCYQVAAMLKRMPAAPDPLLALDLLTTFQDENAPLPERRRLLESCLPDLRRLCAAGPLLVCARPLPRELIETLGEAAGSIWRLETPAVRAAQPPLLAE